MKKYHKLLLLLVALATSLVACENLDQSSSYSEDISEQTLNNTVSLENQQIKRANESYQEEVNADQVNLLQNADLYFETLKYDDAKQALFEVVENIQGSIQYQNEYLMDNGKTTNNKQELRELSLVARIPQADFNETLKKLQDLPDVLLRSASKGVEDVTRSVNDIEIRIEAVEERLDRLNDLLGQAEQIEEIVQIQTEIENAIIQRDQYLSEKSNLENQIEQATINITLSERYVLAEERNQNYSFTSRIANTFKEALVSTKWMLENLVLLLVAAIPLLIIWMAIYLLYRLLFKKLIDNYRKNHASKKKVNRMLNHSKVDKES
ncbi:DUF4349 domain-containing protein [Facklamia sp. 7083-14-GEN3]|uniref:DUF4349 domain-containing protein n=1 Tax=Facklamia sp. 7083-14-GEN3 TaxID=2973478 RepID=UPI00215C8D26|nr:DUF4349 domain-containing protein [Facklamia sp. 7083-14-GEN3]MCR8969751.1 DUF4349 domain-containing protein [Facklamia sp. 7083-14-GEN3]